MVLFCWGHVRYTVAVADINCPYEGTEIINITSKITLLKWRCDGKRLLMATDDGSINIYRPERSVLQLPWTLMKTANVKGASLMKTATVEGVSFMKTATIKGVFLMKTATVKGMFCGNGEFFSCHGLWWKLPELKACCGEAGLLSHGQFAEFKKKNLT